MDEWSRSGGGDEHDAAARVTTHHGEPSGVSGRVFAYATTGGSRGSARLFGNTMPEPPSTKPLRFFVLTGAAVGVGLANVISMVTALEFDPRFDSFLVNYCFWPTLAGLVVGLLLGWSFGMTRRPAVSFFPSFIAWVLLSALLAGLVPTLLFTLYGWATGIGHSGFPLRGTGPPVTPFGIKAAVNAFGHAALWSVFLGLPAAFVGAIIGSIIAIVKWVRRKDD